MPNERWKISVFDIRFEEEHKKGVNLEANLKLEAEV